ncbi:MAG TPA: DnaJ C-terminal domain-containing protein, partial [Solirubrobacterales bacterium]|nr:DnaJ C-terminal domain-containing protein [Solirubrobacterales bacterium]
TTVTVATLEGEREIELEAGVQPGHEETLRGAGLPRLGGRKRGDQRIVVEVVVPTNLSDEQRETVERLDVSLGPDNLGPQHGDGLFGRFRKAFR